MLRISDFTNEHDLRPTDPVERAAYNRQAHKAGIGVLVVSAALLFGGVVASNLDAQKTTPVPETPPAPAVGTEEFLAQCAISRLPEFESLVTLSTAPEAQQESVATQAIRACGNANSIDTSANEGIVAQSIVALLRVDS